MFCATGIEGIAGAGQYGVGQLAARAWLAAVSPAMTRLAIWTTVNAAPLTF